MIGYLAFVLFAATIPAANWLIGNVGTVCIPQGPCLIPVGFGLEAPSGVLMVGAALVLRDIVHERLGGMWALAAIAVGAVLSIMFASPALVVASVAAFALAELADFAVYTPLRRRHLTAAVLASGVVGSIIDSAVFLQLAFGSLDHIEGQVVGKLWMTFLALPVLWAMRARANRIDWQARAETAEASLADAVKALEGFGARAADGGDGNTAAICEEIAEAAEVVVAELRARSRQTLETGAGK